MRDHAAVFTRAQHQHRHIEVRTKTRERRVYPDIHDIPPGLKNTFVSEMTPR